MKPAVALSGGVDSLAAVLLLREQGHDVFGIHFRTGYDAVSESDMVKLADHIGIPIRIIDVSRPFHDLVIDYFSQSYRSGRTPNPCLVCNPYIKFGHVMDLALDMGATHLATGHYARAMGDDRAGYRLFKGKDRQKDQSYFLAMLSRNQLARACFPLGDMLKSEIRALVAENGLVPVTKTESQDVCFIREVHYGRFLEKQGLNPSPGPIVDTTGREIGRHKGLHLFTVGQRKGINCPASEPYYVIRIDHSTNQLVVGFKPELYADTCRVVRVNWIHPPETFPARVHTRVRYRHTEVPASIRLADDPPDGRTVHVRFDTPQAAITPGQGAVFYDGEQVLGGGWIDGTAE